MKAGPIKRRRSAPGAAAALEEWKIRPTLDELAAVPLLESLPRKELEAVAKLFTVRTYARNAIVSNEGEVPDVFNFILSGSVQAFWRDQAGHQLNLGVDGPGGHFADVSLGGEPVLVSRVALSEMRVAEIRMEEMRKLLKRHPQVTFGLLMDVVARLRRMLSRAKTLTMEDVYGRIVKMILAATVEVDGRLVTEPLTHAQIALRVGATREMVGRVLRELARGGYVRSERGRLVVLKKLPARW